jgi:hypothetical protein
MEAGAERAAKAREVTDTFFGNEISLHEMIAELLHDIGKSDIKLCTFSIGEEAIRGFIELIDEGLIGTLIIVTDFTVKKNKIGMLLFASETAKIYLNDVHAKIVHISNVSQKATIITTSNLNRIKRYEAGIVYRNNEHCDFFGQKLDELIENSIPFVPGE